MPQSSHLHQLLSLHANASNARAMSAYMKNHFAFFGIKATERRLLFKQFVAGYPQISKAEMLLFCAAVQQPKLNGQPPFHQSYS